MRLILGASSDAELRYAALHLALRGDRAAGESRRSTIAELVRLAESELQPAIAGDLAPQQLLLLGQREAQQPQHATGMKRRGFRSVAETLQGDAVVLVGQSRDIAGRVLPAGLVSRW